MSDENINNQNNTNINNNVDNVNPNNFPSSFTDYILKPIEINQDDNTIIKRGCSGANLQMGSGSTSGMSSSNSGSSSIITGLLGSQGKYKNTTRIGYDGFVSIGKFPVVTDDDGITRTYDIVDEIKVWYTSTYVYDVTGANSVKNNEIPYYSGTGNQDYWHFEPTLTGDNYYQQLCYFKLLSSAGGGYYYYWFLWTYQDYLDILGTIAGNYSNNQFTFTTYDPSTTRALEFNRQSYTPYPSYSQEVIDIMYNCSVRMPEFGLWYNAQTNYTTNFLTRWAVGSYSVKLIHNTSTSTDVRNQESTNVDNWIILMNSTISGSGVSFYRDDADTTPSITLQTGTHLELWGTNPSIGQYTYGGTWETTTTWPGNITSAYVKLNNQLALIDYFTTFASIVCEELTQSCSVGSDLTTKTEIINSDFNYVNKNPYGTFKTIDANIQKLVYIENLQAGLNTEQLALLINPSNGLKSTQTTSITFNNLEKNATYNYRIYQVDVNNYYTPVSTWYSFTTPNRPDNFTWTTNIANGNVVNFFNASTKTIYPISAEEFNNLLVRINDFRVYCGLGTHSYNPIVSGDEFTRERFNQARTMLVDLYTFFNGYSLLRYRQTGDNILESEIYLNLTNCLNSIL